MNSQKLLAALLFFLVANLAFAQEKNTPVRLLITGALELGGDAVATVNFTNGNDQNVNAGQGISVGVGGEFALPGMDQLRFRSTVGIKYVTTAADNAHIRLTRIPFHFTGNYVIADKFRIGAGLVIHSNIKFNAGGLGDNFGFQTASGPIFEFAYKSIGLSYTVMTYTDEFGNSYAANAIGLTLSGVIPGRR